MSHSPVIEMPSIEGVDVEFVPPNLLKMKGIMAKKEPSAEVAALFKRIHGDVIARRLPTFCVDVTGLTFVNSSSIRLFIDWAVWIKGETIHRYLLTFRTSRQITWQTTAFAALSSLMKEVVSVERV
jgi:hypothetical protein